MLRLAQISGLLALVLLLGPAAVPAQTRTPDCVDYARYPAVTAHLDLAGFSKSMVPMGHHLYVAANLEGLHVVDLSDPAQPISAHHLDTPGQAFGLDAADTLIYLADGHAGLRIYSVANPVAPQLVGAISDLGKVRVVKVTNSRAYLAITDGTADGVIVDVSDPTQPVLLGQLTTGGQALDIEVLDSRAYLLDADGSLAVFDINNPAQPMLITAVPVAAQAYGMDRNGTLLAVAAYLEGVVMVDLASPDLPQIEGSLIPEARTSTFVTAVHLAEDRGYCVTNDDEVVVFEVNDPTQPRQLTSLPLPDAGADVAVHQGAILATMGSSGLYVTLDNGFDLPLPVGDLAPYERFTPGSMALDSGYAFVASDQLKAVRISVPTHPQLVASRTAGETNYDLAVAGHHGYLICDPFNQILVYDLTNPQSPVQAGQIYLAGNHPDLVQTHDGYLYSGPHSNNLGVFDLASPQAPELLGYQDGSRPFSSMTVQGDSLFLGSFGQVGVFDISNPAEPTAVATIDAYNTVQGLAVAGRHVFMLTEGHGLDIADLNQPGHPVVGHYPAAHAVHITMHQGTAYLSDALSGIHVLNLDDITAPRLLGIKRGGCVSTAVYEGHLIASGSGFLGGVEILPLQCAAPSLVPDHQLPPRAPQLAAYPNPFNPTTTVRFQQQVTGPVDLAVYDASGKMIRTLVAGETFGTGGHEVDWNGRDQQGRTRASGVYFVRLKTAGQTRVLPITLLK